MTNINEIIETFKNTYPLTAEKYAGYAYDPMKNEFIILLNDGSAILYDPCDNSIRNHGTFTTEEKTEDDLQFEFAKRLADRLERTGMTQTELSEATGISRQTISRYVNGSAMPSLSNLISIAIALNCKTSEFID